jgi:sugar O-acyltransferase (sialic acid O-acetyltransferase NeuD family)
MLTINRIFLYGASGHAKVICEILEAQSHAPSGFIDDNPVVTSLLEYNVYNTIQKAALTVDDHFIISIGNNRIRKAIAAKLNAFKFASAIHPAAVISPRSSVGYGTVVMSNVSVNVHSTIGNHVILNTNCSIDHDCKVEDFVHVSPNAALAGNVQVGEGTQIGIGACVMPNIRIGKWVMVGAGAVIIQDVPDYAVVVGNPGRVIKMAQP